MLYNADRKFEYINFKSQDTVWAEVKGEWYFNRTRVIEEYLDKDVCDFTTTEIIGFLKSMSSPSSSYLNVIKAYLEGYARWCQSKGLIKDGQNHFSEITPEMVRDLCTNSTTLKNQILTKSELLDIINDINRPCDQFLALAVFEGIGGIKNKEFWHLKMDDFEGGYVNLCTGRRLKVSDKLVELARESSETFEDIAKHNFKPWDDRVLKARTNTADDETPAQMYRRIWLQLDRLSKEYGICMAAKSLKESGRIDMIKRLQAEGESPEDTYKAHYKEITDVYGKITSYAQYFDDYSWAFE